MYTSTWRTGVRVAVPRRTRPRRKVWRQWVLRPAETGIFRPSALCYRSGTEYGVCTYNVVCVRRRAASTPVTPVLTTTSVPHSIRSNFVVSNKNDRDRVTITTRTTRSSGRDRAWWNFVRGVCKYNNSVGVNSASI